ncbi:transglutaminase domain-containing protein [Wukongibacter baidiensis]|uniref:transglutaminase-like domain-containing protein n=1 Tax=Wukongibacter baidiensis TaxID=1723361 RepID=UPI003D7FDB71
MDIRGQRKSKVILGFFMVYPLNILIMKALYFEISLFKIFIMNLAIWLLSYGIIDHKKYFKEIRIIFFSTISFSLLSLLPNKMIEMFFYNNPNIADILKITSKWVKAPKNIEFALWAAKYMSGQTTERPDTFVVTLLIILFTIISIIFSILIIKKKRLIYFILPITFFILQWFRYTEGVSKLFNLYAAGLILYYISIVFNDKINKLDKENSSLKYYNYKSLMYFGSIMVIITIFTSNLIINTLSVSTINDKMSNIFPGIFELRSEYKRASQSKFSFGSTPYQPLGNRLGGSIVKKDMTVMRVKSSMPLLYLRGRVNNIYTGYSWYSDNSAFVKIRKSSPETEKIRFKKDSEIVDVTIYPDNILTSTVFSPYFPVEIEADKRKINYNSDLEMYFVRGFFRGVDGSYTIKSVLPLDRKGEVNIEDERSIERDKYLQLPDNLPKRISDLAMDLTKGYESDYEKIKALEKYLVENYTYSLTVSDIPEGKDFVDYFLFEDNKGYCTYYASSLAVMGRTLGIPTRYVQGFLLPEDTGEDGLYEVKAERAHAWVEAYIDNIGWINFEPTSPYHVEVEEKEIEKDLLEDEVSEKRDLSGQRKEDLKRLMEEEDMPFPEGDYRYTAKGEIANIRKLVPIVLLFIIALRFFLLYYRNKRIFSKTDHRKYIVKNYYIIISLYSFIEELDFEKYSPQQFLRIIDKNFIEIDVSNDIIDSINRAFYSNESISEDDVCAIDEFRVHFEKIVIQKIGKVSYLCYKYLLGNIYRRGDKYGTLWKNTSP